MPFNIEITDADVQYAESILLPVRSCFDDERKEFIKCLRTVDLQAVPGSGKTTALIAKLIVLDRHLPLEGGSGVLVISHTNTAVNEIKIKLGDLKVIGYPNWIGTIHSFANTFLAFPSFTQYFGFRPRSVDNQAYREAVLRQSKSLPQGTRKWLEHRGGAEETLPSLRFDEQMNLVRDGQVVLKAENASETYRALQTLIMGVLGTGILHFDHTFFLANLMLKKSPTIRDLLRKRFIIVCVDEMQDMSAVQHALLENLFAPDSTSSPVVYQRIGDRNQAIYTFGSPEMKNEVWSVRPDNMTLTQSNRLTQSTANIVSPFAIHETQDFLIAGARAGTIKPHLLLYDDETRLSVIRHFADVIERYKESGDIEATAPASYKAVAWNAFWGDADPPHRVRLVDYHPTLQPKRQSNSGTIRAREANRALGETNGIVEAYTLASEFLVRVLAMESVDNPMDNNAFTERTLTDYLSTTCAPVFEHGKGSLLAICRKFALDGYADMNRLKALAKGLLRTLGKDKLRRKAEWPLISTKKETAATGNRLVRGNIVVQIDTVHSVKGETHTATLYLESDFRKKYESERHAARLLNAKRAKPAIQETTSAKMVYVGFSRPTHLLCFAVHADRFKKHLSAIDKNVWTIETVPQLDNDGAGNS